MILFQKKYKILFILWVVFFCPFTFSNPLFFNPMLLGLSPLQPTNLLPQGTPLQTLCPAGMNIIWCLEMTNAPFLDLLNTGKTAPSMFTPVSVQPKAISSRRSRSLLRDYSWSSYEYSESDHKLKRISKEDALKTPEEEDYYRVHIEKPTKDRTPPRVIREEKNKDRQVITEGQFKGIRAEDVLEAAVSATQEEPTPTKQPETAPAEQPEPTIEEDALDEEEKEEDTQEDPPPPTTVTTTKPTEVLNIEVRDIIAKDCRVKNDSSTAASAVCADCVSKNTDVNTKVQDKIRDIFREKNICTFGGLEQAVRDNFRETCPSIDFKKLRELITCKACKAKVPPAVMLSIMSLESTGNCKDVQSPYSCNIPRDNNSSYGMFQAGGSPTCSSSQCRTILNRNSLQNHPQCMGNPVLNIEKSLENLHEKYSEVNNKRNPSYDCNKPSLSDEEIDLWRKTLSGYNGGQERVKAVQQILNRNGKPPAIHQEAWEKMSHWEQLRIYYFHCDRLWTYDSTQNKDIRNCLRPENKKDYIEKFTNSMNNLSYVEAALGRSSSDRQINMFHVWNQSENIHNTSQCPR